ncbi:LysR family transcriptional regulator [Pusillimonas sp. TS35]|uniref:LysR family transcriptional regulator n=1 Tax=Paracandidimonas lactea TaxID=2895524 RepID=UPI001368CE2E|nr:LysR family transcriptional regulator [Paracandidimonas lactea]MYN12654.1 LysR family transcriptional regulator [Pusillimonas sp. TS35]
MRGQDFVELHTFVTVAEQRSFTKAAAQLSLALSTVSQTVRALEERLGVRLLNRTTRSVSLTEAGENLLANMQSVLNLLDHTLEGVNLFREKPKGTLRLLAIRPVAAELIAQIAPAFLAQYPDIALEIAADDSNRDIVRSGFDAGIRIAPQIEKDMIAVPILKAFRVLPVAAPTYLARRGNPATPEDLKQHECLRLRLPWDGSIQRWRLCNAAGQTLDVNGNGSLIVNDIYMVLTAALEGMGIGYLPEPMITAYLANGRLVPLLPEWSSYRGSLYLHYSNRRQMPMPLRAFIDFLEQHRRDIKTGSSVTLHVNT